MRIVRDTYSYAVNVSPHNRLSHLGADLERSHDEYGTELASLMKPSPLESAPGADVIQEGLLN